MVKELLMTKKQKERYYEFEDVLHHRFLHRPLEDRSESAEILDLSKELVQDTNWMLDCLKEKGKGLIGTP